MLRVLLYSIYFHPSLGGVETVSLTLAEGFTERGVECKVITTTEDEKDRLYSFEVIRNPSNKQQIDLVKWADIVLFNGVNLAMLHWIFLFRKPLIWVHVGYQVSCIDGLGWVDGNKAPISPLASVFYHSNLRGWPWALKQGGKLFLKRLVAKYLVAKNIAITKWMEKTQPLPRQVHIYNPFPIDQFLAARDRVEQEYDFFYLGRLVSEKGVSTLLMAFAELVNHGNKASRLLIIGDGKWRDKMEVLAHDLNIDELVTFVGKQSGKDLVDFVSKGKIGIIPSEWFEPMGGVAIELMAAGKNLIVSEFGGLKECVGDCGLTFPNGDFKSLASCMARLLNDKTLQAEQLAKAKEQIKKFEPSKFIAEYIEILSALKKRK